ncbi:MAG: hypothetical protein JNN11_00875 [Candidatus Doudnabacteria bacterium]|nr:hypothetical protein [Candidatus Doudnabacteria bacterium]
MAEINLLKNPSGNASTWQTAASVLVKVLVFLAVGVVAYYVFLYFKLESAKDEVVMVENNIVENKKAALNMPGREELLSRQLQLKEFAAVTAGHAYYSKFLPALAKVTLKNAYFTNISLNNQGKMSMQAVVPTLLDLDKFLQVFNDPLVSSNFYNVRLGGFTKAEDQNGPVYTFNIQLDFNPAILAGGQ